MTQSDQQSKQQTSSLSDLLAKVSTLKAFCIGDGILDEYCYVRPLGKSPKEHLIATQYTHREVFRGGVWAAAKHLEGFCKAVDVETGFITTTKRRFVEEETIRKLFEVHEAALDGNGNGEFSPRNYDLSVVADFGHGCITPSLITWITKESKFLAVNAQTNSANTGFNLVTKYPRADYVVVDELEARLALHDRESPIEEITKNLAAFCFDRVVVTLGRNGSVGYDKDGFCREPSVASSVRDTLGAGDAFFAVTAPFAAVGASMRDLLKIGNAAGAVKCGIVGHSTSVTKEELLQCMG
jgi:bifunctional ADP-heptose synthase (sugar kinase/adenylyltransferase)